MIILMILLKPFRFIVLLFLMLSVIDSIGQTSITLDVPRVVPISPTAAAMTKYQSYPVEHSTGIPNINIPLYQIIAGEVSIPVSLSYHASGLKPKDASTYVGTGWTLNLEPSVTRQVCGLADDDYYGWFNDPSRGYTPPDTGYPSLDNPIIIDHYNQFVNNLRDTQPDKFSYKLPNGGGSGYFIYGLDFLSIPRNNDKVEYLHANGLRITDGKGIQYRFDGEREQMDQTVTRWMCKSIWSHKNPNHALVEFSYTTIPHFYSLGHYYNLDNHVIITKSQKAYNIKNIFTVEKNGQNQHYFIDNLPNNPDAQLRSISEYEAGVHYPGTRRHISNDMTAARLNEVNFLGNKILVTYTSVGSNPFNSDVLNDIKVLDQNGLLVRRIRFYITPYNSNTSLTKLDSVVITAPGVEARKYAFDYNYIQSVPPNYTKAVDHWGFCNGPDYAGGSTVPSFQQTMVFPNVNGGIPYIMKVSYAGASREPNADWTKTGVLAKITDPQGITTSFTYEGNFGAFRDNAKPSNKDYLHPVGGLRIKRIENRDPITNKWTRSDYTYGLTYAGVDEYKPVWGGGAIKHIVSIRDYTSNTINRNKDPSYLFSNEEIVTFNSMPESNITFNGGSSVMYNIVSEIVTNSADENYLKTNYTYNVKMHNFEDVLHWDDADPLGSVKIFLNSQPETVLRQITRITPAHPREPSDDYVNHHSLTNQLYGKLIRKDQFRNHKLASKTEYTYKKETVWGSNVTVDLPHRLITGDTEGLSATDVFTMGNYYFPSQLSGVQTTYYLDTENYAALDKETETMYYEIDGRLDEIANQKTYLYQFDWTNSGSSLRPRQVQTINSDNTVIVDSMDYLIGFPDILSRHKRMEGNRWKESQILFKPNSNLPEKVQSRTDQTLVFRDEVSYNVYDTYGNVTELMGKDGIPVSFIWAYRGQFPVAKIENATIGQVYDGTNVFGDWATYAEPPVALWSKLALLRTELPQTRITTFQYDPLKGVVSITDPNNMTTKFNYDHYGRLTNSYFLEVKSPTDVSKAILQKYIYNFGK